MNQLAFIPVSEIARVSRELETQPVLRCETLADMFRVNALYMIRFAGSGHIGSSFSCLDILTWLWTQEMNAPNLAGGDLCFSSKGHDAPGLYALMIGLGRLDEDYLHRLRQLDGLPGHPDVHTPGIVTNTGSLGMGISKARGMVLADRLNGVSRNIYVLTGDGELQEGQFWESLQPTANANMSEITVIVDHNKIQSDLWIRNVSDLGNLEAKFRAFGWEFARCDGHDPAALQPVFEGFQQVADRPKILVADTLKGKGVSFMEPHQLADGQLYAYHSGAPAMADYQAALEELLARIQRRLQPLGIAPVQTASIDCPVRPVPKAPQSLIKAYGETLVELAGKHEHLVALDGDLMKDTGLLPFKEHFPERFVECGIAEQDMVSVAGGLALQGKLPVVHSFACFLSTRPNEQIYNNATEGTKIIYAGSLAGLLPSGPGHSHQSVRDISLLGSIPGLKLLEPCNEHETALALKWAVEENAESTYLRLTSIPVDIGFELPGQYALEEGRGVALTTGCEAILFAYGPVMLSEAVKAAEQLRQNAIGVTVVNLPWLNRLDSEWFLDLVESYPIIFSLDNHYRALGQGAMLAAALAETGNSKRLVSLGLDAVPRCGLNHEVLAYHQLDAASIASSVALCLHPTEAGPTVCSVGGGV